MSDLEATLSWLGMSQYLESFMQAGFDCWDTVLEITEADLDTLGVELGHRRKLQREISKARRLSQAPAPVSPSSQAKPSPGGRSSAALSGVTKQESPLSASSKRGYRHHPKPDGNAPARPYSAYVMFSNWVREETKQEPLAFADISRQVGDRWQKLSSEAKEEWKRKAAGPWDKYKQDLAEYQKTENHRRYSQYVADFNAAQATKKDTTKGESKNEVPAAAVYSENPGKLPHQQVTGDVVAGLPLSYNTKPPSAAFQGTPIPIRAPNGDPRDPKRQATGIPIPRISWTAASGPTLGNATGARSSRVNQACEPCRQRKSKCDGERPVCKQCHALSMECYYRDGKKDNGKKLTEQVWKKVKAYEDLFLQIGPELNSASRTAARRVLLLPPQLKNAEEAITRLTRKATKVSHSTNESDGESIASGVGSMGSTDHVNEDHFTDPTPERQDRTYAGPASGTTWMQKLTTELTKDPNREANLGGPNSVALSSSMNSRTTVPAFNEQDGQFVDVSLSAMESQIDPYEMPVKPTADALLYVYLNTVHPSFPILNDDLFLNEYAQYFASSDREPSAYQAFVPKLHIIFAIAAVHAHMTEAKWVGDDRDHLLYFARARVTTRENGFPTETIDLNQVQIFGLASMYFLASHQVNRAWAFSGLAIRSAQGLGMHLENVTPYMSESDKSHRMRIWYSILAAERILSMVTGRPCMIKEHDCCVPPPLPPSPSDDQDSRGASLGSSAYSSRDLGRRHSGSRISTRPSLRSPESGVQTSSSSDAMTYFFHFVELHSLSQGILEGLYAPNVRNLKWSEIQRRIIRLNDQLSQWTATLPDSLEPNTPSREAHTEAYRVNLAIMSHGMRAIINRPCLCSIDRRIAHQSDASLKENREAANKCVSSAQTVLSYLSNKPDPHSLRWSPVWWMLLHHIKRAATVLLLELSYRAEHMPSEAGEILQGAKKAVNWLRSLGSSSVAAYRSWVTLSNLLRLAAQRVGGSTDDTAIATSEERSFHTRSMSGGRATSGRYMPSQSRTFDPIAWDPMNFFEYGGCPVEGNMQMDGLDNFGFYQQYGEQNLFPSAGGVDQMAIDQDQQHKDPGVVHSPDDMWFGFDPTH